MSYWLPGLDLAREQSGWLASARARLLRRVRIGRQRRVVNLGCGFGWEAEELARRAGGRIIALDADHAALVTGQSLLGPADRLCADAHRLPFVPDSLDVVFCQFVLLWLRLGAAIQEIGRVLRPGGWLAAIEPDYGGLIEHPRALATRAVWIAALRRAGADPFVGRRLPGLLARAGFQVEVRLLDRLEPPSPARFALLAELPLCEAETKRLRAAQAADAACDPAERVAHLPVFLIAARKRAPSDVPDPAPQSGLRS